MDDTNGIQEGLLFIDHNLDCTLDLHTIAESVGYSEYHFAHLFKNYMGISVMEYVKTKKLRKACEEIYDGAKVLDVAIKYGYQSHNGFTKAFKQEFGISPSFVKAMKLQLRCIQGGDYMNDLYLMQPNEHCTKEELYTLLLKQMDINRQDYSLELVKKSYDLSCKLYSGIERYSGDEYVTHPLHVAILLASMEAEQDCVIAGLFCDVFKKTKTTKEELKVIFPSQIVDLIELVNNSPVQKLMEVEDERCIMVLLAERLHNMRTLTYMSQEIIHAKTKETLEFFLPIAKRIGNQKIYMELKKLSLKE